MLPRKFDNYELIRELGQGAFGTVYLARQPALDREVAIKILLPEASHDRDFIVRFQREARMAASLRHPNIVQVFNASQVADQYYIAMEYIDGKNLRELLDGGYAPDWRESIEIALQLLLALQHAHSKDIIHRDIKPANILIDQVGNRVVLTDFSIAHMKDASRLTTTGHYLGTPEYIAPEILDGVPVSPATDLYAVGLILYEMVTGVHPFRGNSVAQVIKAQLFNVPRSPDELNPQLPRAVAKVITQALLKDSSKRPQSALEMSKQLKHAREEVIPVISLAPVGAPASPPPPRSRKSAEDIPAVVLVGAPPQAREIPPVVDSAATIPVEEKTLPPLQPVLLAPPEPIPPPPPPPSSEKPPPVVAAPAQTPHAPRRFSWGRLLFLLFLLAVTATVSFLPPLVRGPVPSSEARGNLVLQTQPRDIFLALDGRPARLHHSGERLSLPAGPHKVVGSLPGHREQRAEFSLSENRATRLIMELRPESGAVRVQLAQSGVNVTVDQQEPQPLADAPSTMPLPVGNHTLVFQKKGYFDQRFEVEVADQRLVICPVDLQPRPARVEVTSKPVACQVQVGGVKMGVTPLNLTLPPGKAEIRLSHKGYHEMTDQLELKPGQNLSLPAYILTRLEPKPKKPPLPPPPVSQPYVAPPPAPYVPPPPAPYSPPAPAPSGLDPI